MGNSEVGHLNIGAGRIVYQDFTRINRAVATGEFEENPVLTEIIDTTKSRKASLHLIGLVSDGGVHSHIDHLVALIRMAERKGLRRVYVHAFMDGRDTAPDSGIRYMEQLLAAIGQIGCGTVATVCGRYYAMDRDNRWDRVQQAWNALIDGRGQAAVGALEAVRGAYGRGETDEFIKPTVVLGEDGRPTATIQDGDSVISFNFRADRVRQITRALTEKGFDQFAIERRPQLASFVTFTRYDKHFTLPVVFPPQSLSNILGEVVSGNGLRQLRIAETEKYAHVTYFFNGGREEPFPLEDRALIPSPRDVATYDLKPEMSAVEVTDELIKRLDQGLYDLVVLNFANGDMVGHSGIIKAAVKACETVDRCLGRIVDKFLAAGGIVLITADHGNAEMMKDMETGGPMTAHSSNPVPFLLINGNGVAYHLRDGGSLPNIAPTILELMGLPVPTEMEESGSLLTRGTDVV
jgi:2,3-bisphosphoglycerate-independent phosphoglycerate mutase